MLGEQLPARERSLIDGLEVRELLLNFLSRLD